jgi:UDP-4-amino-4,6-dideoxy-N-acetyl-beta-L-altrosamine transaminase
MIPYGCQDITDEDIKAVTEVLKSEYLTQGPQIAAFEASVAEQTGAKFAVAVNSATSALHLAYLALGAGPGDVVWTVPNTFVATANAALYCGADIDFVDIDETTCNMSVAALDAKLRQASAAGKLPKIVVPVHFGGEPCDMAAIGRLAKTHGFAVVEDASHAIGAHCDGEATGACGHSDITVFSFHPVKIITTAEGGLLTTNDAALARGLMRLRTHGITRQPDELRREDAEPWYYEQIDLGFNYRITDMQAALGKSQMTRLEDYIAARHRIADRYDEELGNLGLRLPHRDRRNRSALHLYYIRWPDGVGQAGGRRQAFEALRQAGIGVNVHYIPVHLQPYYRERGFRQGDFPVSEDYYKEAISLPIHPRLTADQQSHVISSVRSLAA